MVVIFMPFLPNLAVFLGISVWYLVPTYWIVVIYRFIESNLESNFGKNFDFWWKKVEKIYIFILNIFLIVNIVFNMVNFYCLTVDEPWFPD